MQLLPITPALANGEAVRQSEPLAEICAATLAMYPGGTPMLPWAGYLAQEGGTIVGTCAFKGPPTADGVELAYYTFPAHEGRGVATRMATALVAMAHRHGVDVVTAQTLPERNPSTRILEKLGFAHVGVLVHPEDGEVWVWRLERAL